MCAIVEMGVVDAVAIRDDNIYYIIYHDKWASYKRDDFICDRLCGSSLGQCQVRRSSVMIAVLYGRLVNPYSL